MSLKIVYSSAELREALDNGADRITLCAGIFEIPPLKNVVFDRIGPVKVRVLCSREQAERDGMVFCGIYPEYRDAYALTAREPMAVVSAARSSSYGSGGSYAVSSFGSGAYFHKYEYKGSIRGSLAGSYRTSFHRTGSFSASSAPSAGTKQSVYVLGYGIDLI